MTSRFAAGTEDLAIRGQRLEVVECRARGVPAARGEVVERFDLRQSLAPQALNFGEGSRIRPPSRAGGTHDLLHGPDEGAIVLVAVAAEGFTQVVARDGVDRRGLKHRRLSAAGDNLGPHPLEVLAGLGAVRQRIHRVLHRDRAQLLHAAPGPHAQAHRTRGELVHQQEPLFRGRHVRRRFGGTSGGRRWARSSCCIIRTNDM